MNEKLCVLAKNQNTFFIKRLIEEVGHARLLLLDPWADSPMEALPWKVLVRTSSVYGTDVDLAFLERFFAPEKIINPLPALKSFRTKKDLYSRPEAMQAPVLPWLDLLAASEQEIEGFLNAQREEEFLIKPHRGQGGWGIRILDRSEVLSWYQEARDKEFLLQPYFKVRECRTFFAGEWSFTLERTAKSGPANFTQGGEGRAITGPAEVLELCAEMKRKYGLSYGAADFLEVQGRWHLIDLNLAPGIQQLENISGQNVLRKILKAIKE